MRQFIRNHSLKFSSLVVLGMLSGAEEASANTFNTIATNAMNATGSVPGLVTGVSYMVGILLAVLGVLKIKDHVENPGQTPLKDGIARLTIGGGLFAVPIVTESMTTLLDPSADGAAGANVAKVDKAELGINP